VIAQRYNQGFRPSIRSVPFLLVQSMYLAFCFRHSNPTLLATLLGMLLLPMAVVPLAGYDCFISFSSPYLPISACGCRSHQPVLSIPNQNPLLGSICGETTELEGREPIVNTPPHLSRHSKGICQK